MNRHERHAAEADTFNGLLLPPRSSRPAPPNAPRAAASAETSSPRAAAATASASIPHPSRGRRWHHHHRQRRDLHQPARSRRRLAHNMQMRGAPRRPAFKRHEQVSLRISFSPQPVPRWPRLERAGGGCWCVLCRGCLVPGFGVDRMGAPTVPFLLTSGRADGISELV
jgi:hypothetical protein